MRPPPPLAMADRALETLHPTRRRRSWHTALRYVLHGRGERRDHRLPRPLHHRPRCAGAVSGAAEGGARTGPPAPARQGRARRHRRPDPREPGRRAAQAATRARDGSHHLLAARKLDGPPPRQRIHQHRLDRALQRPHPPDHPALPRELRRRRPASADPRRAAHRLHPGAGTLRRRARLRRLQPEPGPERRLLDRPAPGRPLVVSLLREDGGARHPRDDPRQRRLQPRLPHHRLPLPRGGHHGGDADDHLRSVPGLSDHQVHRPARRRRGPLPLGPLPGPGRHDGQAAARRVDTGQRLVRHLRLPPARDRPAARSRPGRQPPVRLGDGGRGARHRPRDRAPLRRHEALHRRERPGRCGPGEDLRGQRAPGVQPVGGADTGRCWFQPPARRSSSARGKGW